MILAISGAMVGIALALFISPLLPARPKLADAMGRLNADPAQELVISPSDRRMRLGRWAEQRLGGLPLIGVVPTKDLSLIGKSTTEHYYRKLLLAFVLFLVGVLASVYSLLWGWDLTLPMLVSLPLAYVGWKLPDRDVRDEAKKARVQFTRAISVYVELVAAERKRDAPITAAMENGAAVSDSWIFRQIRQELTRARYDNQEPWRALEALAERIGVTQLADTARVIGLAGSEGAAVYEALRALGMNMRTEILAEEQTRSNRITEQLNLTITALAGAFVALVLVPTIIALMG